MAEDIDIRLRRLRMRSWRRGIREMDLILGGFADAELERLVPAELDAYELLLSENDHDLYGWISEKESPPELMRPLIERIRRRLSAAPSSGPAL